MTGHAAPEPMCLSRNETESLCVKAARGAGFSWGMAEEAGFACGWLAARGIDGTGALLALLTGKLGPTGGGSVPIPAPGYWRGAGEGPLCPITVGSALVDHARLADGPFARDTRLSLVGWPILLLPFLVRGAEIRASALLIETGDSDLRVGGDGGFDWQKAVIWVNRNALAMTISPATSLQGLSKGSGGLPMIAPAVLSGLNGLAMRTVVPASAASRQGAGSVMSDND